MVYSKGQMQPVGAGRAKGVPNKRTQVLEGLSRIYGSDALPTFIAQLAQQARGMTTQEALDAGLEPEDRQLPCLHSQKMIIDRLIPTLKPIEMALPALGEGKTLSDTELTERIVAQLVKTRDPELINGLISPQKVPNAENQPELAQSASIVSDEEETLIGEDSQEDTPS